ncbi:hypothetical protein GCM10022254_21360 [Actinomadura meridiana]|uniref:Uncharacterized protein n=1 Tax=Actinomadura meridiana TaxID=559626 RepID=A0ABP8BXI5_9ACTN
MPEGDVVWLTARRLREALAVSIAVHSSFGPWGPSIVVNCGAIAASLSTRFAIRVSLRLPLPSDAIAMGEVPAWSVWMVAVEGSATRHAG